MKRDEVPSADKSSGTEATNTPEAPEKVDGGEQASGLRRGMNAAATVSHPKMRSDLRFVHEGPGAEDGQRLPGLLRIIDLRNDRKFDFSAQEHFLCKEADGISSPDDLQQRLAAITDQPMTAVQVAKFFRRLNILGLLEPEDVQTPAATAPRLRNRAGRGLISAPGAAARRDGANDPGMSKLTLVHPEPQDAPPAATEEPTEDAALDAASADTAETPAATTTRRFAPRKPVNRNPLEDDDDASFVDLFGPDTGAEGEGRFGGRMRPGMGGMGGGMMGMGGGMMGMRGRPAPEAVEKELGPTQFPLFNPDLLFRVLYFTLWPLKFLLWTMLPLTVFSGLTLIRNMPAVGTDLVAVLASSGIMAKLIVGVMIDNLGSRIAQGVAITAHGGKVKSLGLNLMLGFLPRFYIDESVVEELDRKGRIWTYGAPLLFRLSLFVFGILFWAVTRESGGLMSFMALMVAKFGLIMFAITAWPLIPHDGMKFIGAILGEPKLFSKSIMAARGLFLTGKLPPMINRDEAWPLALYAIGMMITTALLLGVGMVLALSVLQESLNGLGVSIFLGLMLIATVWFLATFRVNKRNMAAMKMSAMAGFAAKRGGARPAMAAGMVGGGARAFRGPQPELDDDRPAARETPAAKAAAGRQMPKTDVERLPNRARVVWSLIFCSLIVAAFLPYSYEAGGEVEILPSARGTAVARTDGEIVEVLVSQGDRVVRGTPLVRLSDWDQLSNVSVREAQLAGARATLAKLEAGSEPEQIDVARAKLAKSQAIAAYKRAEVERARSLVASETVSPATVEKAESDYATATADVEADKASLALTLAGPTKEELEIARSEVDRLERELAFDRDELQRTVIVAPVDGTITTADLQLRVGDYLKTGEEFLKIEQTDEVTATIAIPEADIAFIKPGQLVRLRSQSQSDIEVTGKILQVAPVAEDAGYGRIVRATAVFPNGDGILRSSMTGWAKIEGGDMLAWEAFLRTIVRFVKIDVWSWIP